MPEADPDEVATRSQKRAQRTRRKLLGAALTLFADRGIETTTIEDITEKADLGKGTFYRHFTNKEELAETLLDSILERLIHSLQASRRSPTSLKEALERVFDVHGRFFVRQSSAALLLFDWLIKLRLRDEESGALGPRFDEYLAVVTRQLQPFLSEQLDAELLRTLAAGVCGLVPAFFSVAWMGLRPDEWTRNLSALKRSFVAGAMSWLAGRAGNHRVVQSTEHL
jgi:AcrR family transcriptional regulator